MPKNVEGGPLGVFGHPLFCKIGKNEGGPLKTFEKVAKKSLTKPKKPAQKIFGDGRDSNPRPSAWQTSKTILINFYAKWQQKLQVWQLVDAAYKAYEICH